jgi:hypothetical protein
MNYKMRLRHIITLTSSLNQSGDSRCRHIFYICIGNLISRIPLSLALITSSSINIKLPRNLSFQRKENPMSRTTGCSKIDAGRLCFQEKIKLFADPQQTLRYNLYN